MSDGSVKLLGFHPSLIILLLINIEDIGQGFLFVLFLITSNKTQQIMTCKLVLGYQTSGQNLAETVPAPPSLL